MEFWNDLVSGKFAAMVKENCSGQMLSNSREVFNIMKPLYAEQDDIESVFCIF